MTTDPYTYTDDDTFRCLPPEWVDGPDGRQQKIQHCETLEDGRWEPFISILATR